ncbi:acyltransferase family protein [Candidatus Nucleicultrix amoebiphila]|jgi:peptidoglycan/LPS O-acetylase OafA/YrhL|uniref:Acyltransferase 3 domain-containing protein n=1 Tax=Candidatus Nucleicultrix amoebiphila FS5 TaxID=1414854 RepID=A0A1W6N3P4_9PROT|nr:acyltransferase family protein [Candidatus Nucleicultrix amoebiphila]ARN84381.1 hypothetical protein GQ61_02485 [Candidatus Nucleicultrix amoebiphila FS5]
MTYEHTPNRYLFLDYLRGFVVALVVFDHALQAYAPHFRNFWFLPDIDSNIFFDIFHMNNNSFMMPILYFLSGIFVLPSLKRRGYLSFSKERFLRLVVPFVVGVPLLSPVVSYADHVTKEGANALSYGEFWYNSMTAEFVQVGIFWFLYYLILLTLIAVVIYSIIPGLIRLLSKVVSWMFHHPIPGFCIFAVLSAIILGVSDLIWGAPWFIGWGRFFHVQASRFILIGVYFFVGVAIGESDLLNDKDFWKKFSDRWSFLVIATIIVGIFYIGFTLNNLDDAYNNELRRFFRMGGEWEEAWPIFEETVPAILVRTTLHGIFCALQTLSLMAIFYRFLNRPIALWQSLAVCSYGIYLIHEGFVVWIHKGLYGEPMPVFFKFLTSGGIAFFVSWLLVEKVLRKIPVLRRIL